MTGTNPNTNPLARANRQVQEAERARLAGKLNQAAKNCGELLKQYPDYVAALHTMGLVLADQAKYQEALGYLHRASMLLPENTQTLVALSGVYLKLGAAETAARTLEEARRLMPDDVTTLATLGEIYREQKEYELSTEALEAALQSDPSFALAEINLALNLVQMGQLEDACAIFEKAVHAGSRDLAVLYNLSQLPASLTNVNLIELIDEVSVSKNLPEEETRIQIAFTKAAVFDKAKRIDEAWRHLLEARRSQSDALRPGYENIRRRYEPLLKLMRNAPPLRHQKAGTDELPMSLFITAPSRSGKTTLEFLLGSLPGVKRGYENPIVENAVRRCFQVSGLPTRSHLLELPPPLEDRFCEHYKAELSKRAAGANVLTNTIPARFEDALRVGQLIPNSRFVFVKRDRYDTALRIFMRHYRDGNEHAFSLKTILEYVDWSHQMMDAAAENMPQISCVLSYERLVTDPIAAVSAVTELCGFEIPEGTALSVGDDRGCSVPYREKMDALLNAE